MMLTDLHWPSYNLGLSIAYFPDRCKVPYDIDIRATKTASTHGACRFLYLILRSHRRSIACRTALSAWMISMLPSDSPPIAPSSGAVMP